MTRSARIEAALKAFEDAVYAAGMVGPTGDEMQKAAERAIEERRAALHAALSEPAEPTPAPSTAPSLCGSIFNQVTKDGIGPDRPCIKQAGHPGMCQYAPAPAEREEPDYCPACGGGKNWHNQHGCTGLAPNKEPK